MIKFRSIYIQVFLAVLLVLSMALFVVPARSVEAQTDPLSTTSINLCLNRSNGELNKPGPKDECPPQFVLISNVPAGYGGICVVRDPSNPSQWGLLPPEDELTLDNNGRNCVFVDNTNQVAGPFVRFNTIPTYTPPGSTNTNNNNNNGKGNTNTTTNNNGGGTNNNTPPQVQGDCEAGFHEVGPLCVPNSPFTNKDALVNSADAPGLAVKIIRILLYFGGIIAVIMAIIGGYQIMTARGNEAQATSGRKTLTNAIIGLIIVILSYIIIQAVINFITK